MLEIQFLIGCERRESLYRLRRSSTEVSRNVTQKGCQNLWDSLPERLEDVDNYMMEKECIDKTIETRKRTMGDDIVAVEFV